MVTAFRNNTALTLAIILSALAFWVVAASCTSLRGVVGPTIAMSATPTAAALWTVAAFAVSLVIAVGLARLVNSVVAMFALGCGVGMLAMRSGTIDDYSAATGSLAALGIETALWGILVLAGSILVFRFGGRLPDAVDIENPKRDGMFGTMAFLSLATGPLVLVGVWAIAVDPVKGQALGAVVVGSLLVGLAGRMMAPITPPAVLYVAPLLFGAAGHFLAHIMLKGDPVRAAFVSGSLLRFAYPMPVDYAAGALAGVSLGIGMARSFLKTDASHQPTS